MSKNTVFVLMWAMIFLFVAFLIWFTGSPWWALLFLVAKVNID